LRLATRRGRARAPRSRHGWLVGREGASSMARGARGRDDCGQQADRARLHVPSWNTLGGCFALTSPPAGPAEDGCASSPPSRTRRWSRRSSPTSASRPRSRSHTRPALHQATPSRSTSPADRPAAPRHSPEGSALRASRRVAAVRLDAGRRGVVPAAACSCKRPAALIPPVLRRRDPSSAPSRRGSEV